MELLRKVMKYLFQSNNAPRSRESLAEIILPEAKKLSESEREKGAKVAAIAAVLHHQISSDSKAKVAAIAAALHHHQNANNDVRAKVAAIAAAIHHSELEASQGSNSVMGVAAVVAAIHHHKNLKK